MCGVIGALRLSSRDEQVSAGIAAIRHRGPDAESVWMGSHFWLGHTRLAIIDTSSASEQPYRYRDVVLSFNGELWNYKELRAELAGLGCVFATTGDTEVLAAALAVWGEDALPRLEGMFAFAWTSDGGETLTLVRDRFGETPLHVFEGRSFFAFASEVKALRALGVHPAGIRWLEPGTLLRVDRVGRVERARWYELPDLVSTYDAIVEEDARRLVRGAIAEGALERTISDVPVCMLLSGGIDSAAVAPTSSSACPGSSPTRPRSRAHRRSISRRRARSRSVLAWSSARSSCLARLPRTSPASSARSRPTPRSRSRSAGPALTSRGGCARTASA